MLEHGEPLCLCPRTPRRGPALCLWALEFTVRVWKYERCTSVSVVADPSYVALPSTTLNIRVCAHLGLSDEQITKCTAHDRLL
ncbi:hypothetical protein Y032_0020g236 [Ancylostoma ceylanicum]|uniref:Uncharacterized protein n=1 Tax=Ancylostoma ceylanicum TaxID=53326 RepID=A0A016V132_9BILA|nr:hypothetical protein Y032_0020g236 [Ancylostoma ceylanicum]